ncbi:LuxR family transcriptional regulator [Burkholderia ubonensis]|uniref:LuxR family transcriptional regulator n=1 Tax=Burkholderia ubonensis TaxID=101571 RepID=UPI0007588E98|nr:LuxR family transcriptional regulator [Burkholderia ubonensis]KWN63321.1 LuxR family transcriptional regulator [Burkholderia ubonensis]
MNIRDLAQHWINELLFSENPDDIASVLMRAASALGFEYAAYSIRRPLPINNPTILTVSNYPCRWQKRYLEALFVNVDSAVKAVIGSDKPIIWSAKNNASRHEFWDEALSFGIANGWSLASRGAGGTLGILTLSRSCDSIESEEMIRNQSIVRCLAQTAHIAMVPYLSAGDEFDVVLTRRETDVLKWTADGKTVYEISLILNISKSTVDFHMKNIISKLGSTNKVQAVAKAALLGMLY